MPKKLVPLTDDVKIACLTDKVESLTSELEKSKLKSARIARNSKKDQALIDKVLLRNERKKVGSLSSKEKQKKREHAERKILTSFLKEYRKQQESYDDSSEKEAGRKKDGQIIQESRSRLDVTVSETSSVEEDSDDFVSASGSLIIDKNMNEDQQVIEGNRIKIYKCGQKLYAKFGESDDEENCKENLLSEIDRKRNCNDIQSNLKNPKLNIFDPRRKQTPDMTFSLRKPFGIKLGSFNINSKCFPTQFKRKQILDVLLVACGMTITKPIICWSQQDIDIILLIGAELNNKTGEATIDKLSQLTKGFTFKKFTVHVTMSESIIVGRISSFNERSIDLVNGLEKFFMHHKQGIFQTPGLNLYISLKAQTFFVFDAEGRTINCIASKAGEAAVMALPSLDDLFHLITNLSNVEMKDPFMICKVEVTQLDDKESSLEKFSASNGNPNSKSRSDDFKILSEKAAYLQGSVDFSSNDFGACGNKQQLTSSIIAIVYAKIDPPNTWSSVQLDRVLHFGTQLYREIIRGGPTKNITLLEIPSKFYLSNLYKIGIKIVPFIERVQLEKTRVFCDNPITKTLRCLYEKQLFHCFLLQVGIHTFAFWQTTKPEIFFFFDGQRKDVSGNLDIKGSSILFMTAKFDKLCEIIVQRVMAQPHSENARLEIHALQVIEMSKLSKNEQNCPKGFKVKKIQHYRTMTPEIAQSLEESTSTVDSVAAVLTRTDFDLGILSKPDNIEITKMNTTSSVCYRNELNKEEETSGDDNENFSPFASNIVHTVFSDFISKVTEDHEKHEIESAKKVADKGCGKFVGFADKVWIKREFDQQILDNNSASDNKHVNSKANSLTGSSESLSGSEYVLAE